MIKYKLLCKDCSKDFESWFSSSKEFEKLKKTKFLNCPNCNSFNIDNDFGENLRSLIGDFIFCLV